MKKLAYVTVTALALMASTASATTLGEFLSGLAGPAVTNNAEVQRWSVLTDGVYVPALRVSANGTSTVYEIGEAGLTRNIVFNAAAAAEWASTVAGVDVDPLFARTSEYDASGAFVRTETAW